MPSLLINDKIDQSHGDFIAQGKQSTVFVIQVAVKQIGIDKGLSSQEAQYLVAQLYYYRRVLTQRGWRLPELYLTRTKKYENETRLTIYEQYIPGPSLTSIIAQQGMLQAIGHMASLLKLIYTDHATAMRHGSTLLHRLDYGVDLKPDNVLLNKATNQLYLIDTFAPKTIRKDGSWHCYLKKLDNLSPNKLMIVTATREGILLRLLRLAGVRQGTREYFAVLRLLCSLNTMSQSEYQFITSEISRNYTFLDSIYL